MANPFRVERPPKEYRQGFKKDGVTERHFDSREALDRFCRENGVTIGAGDPEDGTFEACFVPGKGIVALPTRKAEPDPWRRKDLREHEWGHAHGWRHKPPPLTKERMAAIRRNLFAQEPAPQTGNLFRER